MRKSRFSVEQIVAVLKQAEMGMPVGDLVRQLGISEQTPAPGVSRWDYVRVRRTVERLKLTEHQILAEERRKVWQKTTKLRDKYQKALAKAATSAAARQEVKATSCEITSLTKPESELSAVAKWCISFTNKAALQGLIA